MTLSVYSFYRFVKLPDYRELKEPLLEKCNEMGIKGTILLAEEGINTSLCAEKNVLDAFLDYLGKDPRLANFTNIIDNPVETVPFKRMFIKLKKEIVNMGLGSFDTPRGEYVSGEAWDQLIQQPDVEMGKFKNAVDPKTTSFT